MTVDTWVFIAILGYLSMAISQLIDKALLNVVFKDAKSFVFLIGVMNLLALILVPFGVHWIPMSLFFWAFLAGALFLIALIPFLSALQGDDASRVIPLVGGLVPLFTFLGEWLFLGSEFTSKQLLAFVFLVAGSVVLTFTKSSDKRRSWTAIVKAILGAALFSASFLISDAIFSQTTFINGFFWMRTGSVFVPLLLLFSRDVRAGLVDFFKNHSYRVQSAYFATQGLNGFGFVLQSYAISLASVSLVNALQGSQYVFILIFIAVGSKLKPGILNEKITVWLFLEKLTAVLFIVAGIALLTL